MVDGAADAAAEALVLGGVEAGGEHLQGVELGELEAYLLGLGRDVLDGLAAVDLDDFVLGGTLEQLEQGVDEVHGEVPLVDLLVHLRGPVEQQFSQRGHRLPPHLLALVLERLQEAGDDAVLEDVWIDGGGVADEESEYFAHLGPEGGLLVVLEELHVVGDVVGLEEVVGDFRVLDDALEVAEHVGLLLTAHALQNALQLSLVLARHDPLGQHLRLHVLEPQGAFVEGAALDDLDVLVADDGLDGVVGLVLDHFLQGWQVLGAERLQEDVDGGGVLYFGHCWAFGDCGLSAHGHPDLLSDVFLLGLWVFQRLLIGFEHELLPAVAGWDLLEFSVSVELLAGTQEFDLVALAACALVLLEVGLLRHLVDLQLALHPGLPPEFAPSAALLGFLRQQPLEQVVEIGGEEVNFGSRSCACEGCDVVEVGRDERRGALGELVEDAADSPEVAGEGVDAACLEQFGSHVAGRPLLLLSVRVHEVHQQLRRPEVAQLETAVLVEQDGGGLEVAHNHSSRVGEGQCPQHFHCESLDDWLRE